ncbi:MAG TPA: hypothetical protein VFK57_00390 [Vicinamibacterales bacterium]|nr:hypothetical protein [Vicinamibacterales bacterium]
MQPAAPCGRLVLYAAPRMVRRALVRIVLTVTVLLACSRSVRAQLTTVEIPEVRIVYFDGTESYLVPHAARVFLNALAFERRLFGFDSRERMTMLLVDLADAGNAAAGVVPRNVISVQIAPLNFAFETMAANERMSTLTNHELVHILTMDQAAGADRTFRRLFGGKVLPLAEHPESLLYWYLTTPRVAAPRWYHEGIAVFVDTWMAGGLGRAQGGYDEMVFRAMVRDNVQFYDPLGLLSEGTKIDFQTQVNSYLYGTRFMTWLARRHTPEKLIEWVSRGPGSRGYYASQFRKVFGVSLESAWQAWVADEHAFQQQNLAQVRQYPLTPFRDITSRPLGSVSRAYFDAATASLYAGLNYPGAVAHVSRIATAAGTLERLVDIKGPLIYTVTSLVWNPSDRRIYYTTDNGSHRDLVQLDPATRRTRVLQKDARIGDLAYNAADRSIWGIRHLNGLSTLVRMKPPYADWERIITWPYGTSMYDIDISPDGSRISGSFGEISGKQDVRVLDIAALLGGETAPVARFDFGTATPNGFVFSPDARYLFGSSYYTGVSNIFRFDLATKKLDAVSNTDSGFFRPVPLPDGGLIVFRYTGQGFVPARIDPKPLEDVSPITFLGERLIEERPVLKTWMLGSPAAVPYDTIEKRTGTYRLGGGLQRESFYPIVQGYKDTAAGGVALNLSDPLMFNRLRLTASVSPAANVSAGERVHLSADYERYDWRASASWNRADFYDLFGPTKVGRKGYRFLAGRRSALVFDEPRRLDLDVSAAVSGNLDRLPEFQNVAVDVDRLVTLRSALTFTDVRNSLGYVDEETGRKWSLELRGDVVNGTLFPRLHGTFDRGRGLPLGHSSIWLRTAGGFSPRDRDDPFANFYFGGFGNNYVDRGDEKRYRHVESLPGVELNEIPARNFAKASVEWNLPPWRFRRLGTPGLHATWLRPAVFATGLATNLDERAAGRRVASIGGQVDLRLTVLSNQDMTLSFGGAVAIADGRRPAGELMLSFKILR